MNIGIYCRGGYSGKKLYDYYSVFNQERVLSDKVYKDVFVRKTFDEIPSWWLNDFDEKKALNPSSFVNFFSNFERENQ